MVYCSTSTYLRAFDKQQIKYVEKFEEWKTTVVHNGMSAVLEMVITLVVDNLEQLFGFLIDYCNFKVIETLHQSD